VAVGDVGTVLKSTDGGSSWVVMHYAGMISENLLGVCFAGPNLGLAVGSNGVILRSTDSGLSWAQQSSGTNGTLYSVHLVDTNIGVIVGETGTILKTTDGGLSWTPQVSGTLEDLHGVWFVNSSIGSAVGGTTSGVLIQTTDGGQSWQEEVTILNPPVFHCVVFHDSQTGTIAGDSGTILQSSDGGSTWSVRTSGTSNDLKGIYFKDSNVGVASGFQVLLRTNNGGLTWSKYVVGTLGTPITMHSVTLTPSDHAVSVGTTGSIYRSTNAGVSWVRQSSSVTSSQIEGISHLTDDVVIAIGDRIALRTTNGGTTWVSQTNGISHIRDLDVPNDTVAYAVGRGDDSGQIIKTTNGGISWYQPTYPSLPSFSGVQFLNADAGFVVGEGGNIIHTTDGGTTWTVQVTGVTNSLNDVCFVNNNVAVVIGSSGTILRTTNEGSSWNLLASGTNEDLHAVTFTGTDNGIAVGANGTILRTSDGGETWMSQPGGGSSALMHVHFSDQLAGTIAGDSGTILSTVDGGISWTTEKSGTNQTILSVSTSENGERLAAGSGGLILSGAGLGSNDPPITVTITARQPPVIIPPEGGAFDYIMEFSNNTGESQNFDIWIVIVRPGPPPIVVFGPRNKTFDPGAEATKHRSQVIPGSAVPGEHLYILRVGTYPDMVVDSDTLSITKLTTDMVTENLFLAGAYPNPLNPSTTISFSVPQQGRVTLKIFNMIGENVATLISDELSAGTHRVEWNASENASGIYFYILQSGNSGTITGKLLLLK